MKLTLALSSFYIYALVSAKDCDPRKPEKWDPSCTRTTTSPSSTTSATSTTLSTSRTSTTSAPTLTVATETMCYDGLPTPTTYTTLTAHQVCTMTTYLTVASSMVYGSPSCFPTLVTRRIASSIS
ncbi:hypothetical protein OPT61_g1633 [Boeremia exigua]|uniref:Uncharacterized protein n=1 Tax=Boeremia exigua TaxID=749465 RepID=A0ACC2IPG0_9PLEO|nr:hypothetical protein OPT61_g1633 [Boeremia exigua]